MPHPTTFKPLAEPTYGVMRKVAFLQALDTWSALPRSDFDMTAPPVDSLADRLSDENAELAAVFYRLTRKTTLSEQINSMLLDILVHERRLELAWDHARSNPDPRKVAPRDGWIQLKPYEAMINVMRDWAEALHQRACEL